MLINRRKGRSASPLQVLLFNTSFLNGIQRHLKQLLNLLVSDIVNVALINLLSYNRTSIRVPKILARFIHE